MHRIALKQFHHDCVLIKNEMCGFPWQKSAKRAFASGYTNGGAVQISG